MTEIVLAVIALVLLLALDLAAVAARTSFMQISHAHLLTLREQNGVQINQTEALLPKLPRVRASLKLTLTLARFGLAGLSLLLASSLPFLNPWLAAVVGLAAAACIIFWLEWVVDRRASQAAEIWALRLTGFVHVILALTSILLFPLRLEGEAQASAETTGGVSESELKTLVDAGQKEGVFEQDERRMIYSIFQLGDTLARQIMVPRIDMLALDVDTTLTEAADAIIRTGHSRVPVYKETVDQTLGLLYAKDLLRLWREGQQSESLHDLLRPAYFVPEAKKVDELLAEMQAERIHMAIVVDEYGGVAGLVTLEDIVEEVLGEIQDEYDQAEEAPYQKQADGSTLFLGRIDLEEFNEIMGSNLPIDEADTLGGYIYSQLGRVPTAGEKVQNDILLLTVEHVSARRIRKVSARWLPTEEHEEDKAHVDR